MSNLVPSHTSRRPGQPIIALMMLLVLWAAVRTLLWHSPFAAKVPVFDIPAAFAATSSENRHSADQPHFAQSTEIVRLETSQSPFFAPSAAPVQSGPEVGKTGSPIPKPVSQGLAKLSSTALSQQRLAIVPTAYVRSEPSDRWSFDGWLFLRPRSIRSVNSGPQPVTYGASQAGAVLRYRFAPDDPHYPAAYLRLAKALAGAQDSDIAVGLAARPVANVPVSAQAELRASHVAGRTDIRPAGFIVTELPPLDMPLDAHITAYAQAGYVGGDFATAFLDGQARLDWTLTARDPATIQVGAGIWGGAQKGASRLDIGPTASVDVKIDGTPIRVAMDYRHRVAGDAEPQSGLAITFSTGF